MEKQRKFSRKRAAVLDKIRSTKLHPSAEWVYSELKRDIPDLSLGTVYRNIAMFLKESEIVSVGVVGGEERFDGDTSEHTHFVCEGCGAVIDVWEVCDGLSEEYMREKYGVEVTRRCLTYYGRCQKCG